MRQTVGLQNWYESWPLKSGRTDLGGRNMVTIIFQNEIQELWNPHVHLLQQWVVMPHEESLAWFWDREKRLLCTVTVYLCLLIYISLGPQCDSGECMVLSLRYMWGLLGETSQVIQITRLAKWRSWNLSNSKSEVSSFHAFLEKGQRDSNTRNFLPATRTWYGYG